jgi:hypothetical protein
MHAIKLIPAAMSLAGLWGIANAAEVTGTATCDRSTPKVCRISWTFPVENGALYSVEQFDEKAREWNRIYGPVSTPTSSTKDPVPEGSWYRALACVGEIVCTGSTVVWAPIHPKSVDEIPEVVSTSDGGRYHVTKQGNYEEQRQQYNAYKHVQMLGSVKDWSVMPPMTTPIVKDPISDSPPEWMDDDLIQSRVHKDYEGMMSTAP